MFCKKCGKEIPNDATFCPDCGAQEQGPVEATEQKVETAVTNFAASDNIAILCYLGLFFLIPYFLRPESKFCRYHCNQGVILLIAGAVFNIVMQIILRILGRVFLLGFVLNLVNIVGCLAILALVIIGIMNVVKDKMEPLPIIGSLGIDIIK